MKTDIKLHSLTFPDPTIKSTRLLILLLIGVFSTVALPSCSSSSDQLLMQRSQEVPRAAQPMRASSAPVAKADNAVATATVPQSRPQLIKKAELTLVVKSIDQSMRAVSAIAQKYQGDILRFQDSQPTDNSVRQIASMQMRVPASRLEATLNDLAKLGTVQSRALTAEDVSDQLVDLQARLKNLRKSEAAVLKIMERSGTVGEVLKVSQELGNIRESIERISAQLNNLQNQVAYSTITLNLEAAVSAAPPPQEPLGLRVQETWGKATHAVSEFTLSLLSLSIWLFAFSPYLLVAGAAAYGYRKYRQQTSPISASKPELPSPVDAQSEV